MVNGQMGIHETKKFILGIDPGRDKTGFAIVNLDGGLICSGIFNSNEREKFFDAVLNGNDISEFVIENQPLCQQADISPYLRGDSSSSTKPLLLKGEGLKFLALGNGTQSKDFYNYLKNKFPNDIKIKLIDEKNTTLEARKLYWKIHKPNLLQRLLPENMRVPKRILDDLAAWKIALRALKDVEI